ncbi:MAG: hypothetical protein HUJ68_13395, partial [Clostridia bacterium]|nr:hypothetical protein [Clostridia bacterium]
YYVLGYDCYNSESDYDNLDSEISIENIQNLLDNYYFDCEFSSVKLKTAKSIFYELRAQIKEGEKYPEACIFRKNDYIYDDGIIGLFEKPSFKNGKWDGHFEGDDLNESIIENRLAEAIKKSILDMQKEGLLESAEEFTFDFNNGVGKLSLKESHLDEMSLHNDPNEVIANPYRNIYSVKNCTPENRWCEVLAAIYFWPKFHNGELMKPHDYQSTVGYDNKNFDASQFWALVKAGYVERIKAKGVPGKGYYKITPDGEKIMKFMISKFGEREVNPFESIKGDRTDRHNLEPSLTKDRGQKYRGEVEFEYQGLKDTEPRLRRVLPTAVYDREIDTGNSRMVLGYDTDLMTEQQYRKVRKLFADVNDEMMDKLGVKSDLKGTAISMVVRDNFTEEQAKTYDEIQKKLIGRIHALGIENTYRKFLIDRGAKATPTNRGDFKSGKLSSEGRDFFNTTKKTPYIDED